MSVVGVDAFDNFTKTFSLSANSQLKMQYYIRIFCLFNQLKFFFCSFSLSGLLELVSGCTVIILIFQHLASQFGLWIFFCKTHKFLPNLLARNFNSRNNDKSQAHSHTRPDLWGLKYSIRVLNYNSKNQEKRKQKCVSVFSLIFRSTFDSPFSLR